MLSSWAFLDLIVILAFIFIDFIAKQIGIILQAKIDIILQASRECTNGKRVMIKITHFTLANISIIQQKLPAVVKTKIPYFHSSIFISWVSEFSKTDWTTYFKYFFLKGNNIGFSPDSRVIANCHRLQQEQGLAVFFILRY